MRQRGKEVLRSALALPPEERAELALEIIASLDGPENDPAEVAATWAAEIERRARRVLNGESAGKSWADVRRRISKELRKR